ncbi:MAG TPA: MFS transporter [Steroidobacteraceae bacterium]|nr:MFS transporter [Steroidobacteraceae bacterium]
MINPEARPCDALAIRSARTDRACAQRSKKWVLAAAVLGSTMAFVDESVVNVALPAMESDLAATLAAMTWVVNAYTLCMSALLLTGGAAADQLGRRRIFLAGLCVFAVASLCCGLAPGALSLIASRAVQGVGAALLIPCSLAIIGAAFEGRERGAAIGIWSGASAIAAGAGPLLGGWLVDHWSWRAIFLINPVIAVPTLWIAIRHLPESRDPSARRGLDWIGALLAFTGLGSLAYGLIAAAHRSWRDTSVLVTVGAGVLLLLGFIAFERRSRAPMMPLELFRSRGFSGVNLLTFLLYGALGGVMFFLPFLLIQVHGYSATAAGAAFLPFTVVLGLLSKWGGGLVDRIGPRWPLIVGPLVVSAGFWLLSVPGPDGLYRSTFLLPMVVLGLGMAITVAPLTTTVLDAVPQHQSGTASGINNAVASVASLLLIALLGTIGSMKLSHSLEEHLLRAQATPQVRQIVEQTKGGFVVPAMPPGISQETAQTAHAIIKAALIDAVKLVTLIGVALAVASAAAAAALIGPAAERPQVP